MLAKRPVVRAALVRSEEKLEVELADEGTAENLVGELPDKLTDWNTAVEGDNEYQEICEEVREGRRMMPKHLGLRVSIGQCSLSGNGDFLFRGRRWVPAQQIL